MCNSRYISFRGDLHSCIALFYENTIRVHFRHNSLSNWFVRTKSVEYNQNVTVNSCIDVTVNNKDCRRKMQKFDRVMLLECKRPSMFGVMCPTNCTCINCPHDQYQRKLVICPDDNVRALDMSRNDLQNVEVGTFAGLSNLNTLDLSGNSGISLEVGIFTVLSNLNTLDLSWNYGISLEVGIFTGLSNLNTLDLSYNNLDFLEVGIFTGLSNLNTLDLSQKYGISLDLEEGIFTGLSNLNTLDLNGNGLVSLEVGIFTGLSNLNTLDLDGNGLVSL